MTAVSETVGFLRTAGETVEVECALPWVAELLAEGAAGELERFGGSDASLHVRIEANREPFDVTGWSLVTRGAWHRGGEVVFRNVCTSGFDLHLVCSARLASFTYRWRPPARDRAAARLLTSRFHLLARAALIQYPALWWAGTRGRVPLHASAFSDRNSTVLLAGAGGVGRSTLVLREVEAGARATGDNLSVADGSTVWGLLEPMRVDGGNGRRMPHGRNELRLPDRKESLVPDRLVVLRRGISAKPSLVPCPAGAASAALVASTYMAGELRRYWAFAATLAAGTGLGPPHPAVADVAGAFGSALPCHELVFASTPGLRLSEMLPAPEGVGMCA